MHAGFNGGNGTTQTEDGFEPVFGVSHLGHFLLANLLLEQMQPTGRIVFVSSDMHDPPRVFSRTTPAFTDAFDLARPDDTARVSMMQYTLAKLSNIMCAYEMSGRLSSETDTGITVNAFNPGLMTDTNFTAGADGRQAPALVRGLMGAFGSLLGKRGSATGSGRQLADLVIDPAYAKETGLYFDRGELTESSGPSHDKKAAQKLWRQSAELVGLTPTETILSIT